MARFVRLLLCLTFVPLVMGTISTFDLRGSSSRRRVESSNFVQKTVPLSALSAELNHIRLRRSHNGQPTSHHLALNDSHNSAIIHYSGTDQKVIFILTFPFSSATPVPPPLYTTNLYRSTDYGYSYTKINDKLEQDNPQNLKLYSQFFVSPENNEQIVFPHYVDSVMYVTTDEGATFRKVSMEQYGNINPRTLVFHPTDGETFLAFNATDRDLYVSHDLGKSFSHVASSVFNYYWGVPGYDKDVSTIYYTSGTLGSINLYQTSDQPSSTPALFDANLGSISGFILLNEYIFCQKTGPYLWVSYKRQPFQQAVFPSEQRTQNYLVASVPDVMAIVIAWESNNVFNLYTSDIEGHYFSESLPDIYVFPDNRTIDLELVDSMNFTFIANQNVRTSNSVTAPSRRTLISFNNAGVWEAISPPQRYYNGSLVSCEPPSCSLHFHMSSSEYARLGVYSQESAPGIIVAHGTVGESLSDNPDLFLSQDGGVTWIMTLESSWGVSVLDQGGLLVAARDYHQEQSNVVMYSCNEGGDWSLYEFFDQNLTIYGLITEPGETTAVVNLFGERNLVGGWEVVLVNFTEIFDRVCSVPQDYYFWSPYDEHFETTCLLGATVKIERRLPSVCCLNGMDYDRNSAYAVCPCSAEDFECDYGYLPSSIGGGACIRDPSVTVEDPCVLGQEMYMQSQGYRKIPGDVCVDGDEPLFAKIPTKCCLAPPANWTSSPSPVPDTVAELEVSTIILGVFLLFAVLVIIVLLASFLVFVCKVIKKRGDGYHRVERLTFHAEESSSDLPADTEDDDDDNENDEDDKLLNP